MKLCKTGRNWTVNSAPIEFVLVGPRLDDNDAPSRERQRLAERDAVLVRTANLQPDLLGLAIESRERDPSSSDLLRVLARTSFTPLRKLNAVRGERDYLADVRGSYYVFAWAGKVDKIGKELVESAVIRYMSDLQAGLQADDPERIEWALTPIVYRCMLVTTGTTGEQDNTRRFAREARLNSYFSVLFALVSLVFSMANLIYIISRILNK